MSLETSAETTLFPQVIKIGHHEKKERSHSIIYFFINRLVKNSSLCLFLLLSSLFFLFLSDPNDKEAAKKERAERERAAFLPCIFPTPPAVYFPYYLKKKVSQKSATTVIYIHTQRIRLNTKHIAILILRTMRENEDDKTTFLKCFERLKEELVRDEIEDNQVQIAVDWIREMISYNVPHGKLNRGIAVMDGMRALRKEVSEKDMWKAMVVGWGIEWLQAYFLVADDIMDESITRRGQPCWYRQPHVKMNAINDGILLEMQIYKLLKRHVGPKDPAYAHLLELFHEVTYQTASGQLIDLITAPIGVVDLSKYTEEAYMRIVTYKTAFYTFYLPAAAAMRLSGIEDEQAYKVANDICVKLGQFFQIQDDYLDCYGDPKVIGKIGTDIKDNKCGWLVVQALKKCTAEQRKIIEENYGKDDAECEKKIKALYVELELEKLYLEYEEKSYKELTEIMEGQSVLPKELFSSMLAKIYKRTK